MFLIASGDNPPPPTSPPGPITLNWTQTCLGRSFGIAPSSFCPFPIIVATIRFLRRALGSWVVDVVRWGLIVLEIERVLAWIVAEFLFGGSEWDGKILRWEVLDH